MSSPPDPPHSLPGVSVAVTARARPGLLERCLASVARQARRPDEVVVSEDGSDAEVRDVVASFGDRLPLRHLKSDGPLGQLRNRTRALSAATHEFVAMLDDDDEWEPAFLERATAALEAHPECVFCSTDHYLISPEGDVLSTETDAYSAAYGRARFETGVHDDVVARELRYTCYSLVTTLFRRSALVEVGFFPVDAGSAVDLGLFLELGARGHRCVYVDERLGRYRIHAGQNTQTAGRLARSESQVSVLRGFGRRHELSPLEQRLLAARYRSAVVELAVAHAHARSRTQALHVLRGYAELGWGSPSPRRLAVLTALLLGARKRA